MTLPTKPCTRCSYSDPASIVSLRTAKRTFARFCDDERFWRDKARRDFGIVRLAPGIGGWKGAYTQRYRLLGAIASVPIDRWQRDLRTIASNAEINESDYPTLPEFAIDATFSLVHLTRDPYAVYSAEDPLTVLDILIEMYTSFTVLKNHKDVSMFVRPGINAVLSDIFRHYSRLLDSTSTGT